MSTTSNLKIGDRVLCRTWNNPACAPHKFNSLEGTILEFTDSAVKIEYEVLEISFFKYKKVKHEKWIHIEKSFFCLPHSTVEKIINE